MCGIGGMLGEPDTTVLHRMNQLQQHRGPDDQGVWSDGQLGFSHARLAIVDVVSSQQPMHGLQGAVLVVNGEIYNHKELRSRHPSYPYTTTGDSESILALHASATSHSTGPINRQRARCMDRSAGWHVRLCSLGCPSSSNCFSLGTPWASNPWCEPNWETIFLFASETKAFGADERYTPALDELALAARLVWEYPLDATTMLKGVHQVRPGTVECWSLDEQGGAKLVSIANIERQSLNPSPEWNPESQAGVLLESFVESVEQRLMADVPVGIVLSGAWIPALFVPWPMKLLLSAGWSARSCVLDGG